MINYLDVLSSWIGQPHYLLLILIILYCITGTIDFLVGTFNAVLTSGIQFSSKTAQLGIIKKIVILSVMVLVVPLALLLPMDFGVYSLTILYLGIVVGEIYSILSHVGLVKDGDKSKNFIGTLFNELLQNIYKSRLDNKDGNKKLGE